MKVILVDAVNTFISEEGVIFEDLFNLLEEYSNRKIILTNADDAQMVSFGLNNVPYPVFSLKHEPDKIDPVYFERMLSHFDLRACDVVYFEHNLVAVKSAESLGIVSFHFDKDVRDLSSLKLFLDREL